ncbi:CPBP family intramembrane metalloprotease [Ruminiclostridium herbifermentans]|uniref:CPBP family intramembrane metalloprotease n=1 Tax=Ruminiclostridium herbifermentans TaxID=2488810 RepID=A0A4U7JJ16_9FIRM|nr:CPBP family intramembrane glutamic endopeptidase [Ruminiclostridium herbifermentans]QNU68564.1 CPBP family intramembrane metalloprotease [Ruminiclostridium herbifermentans]
MITKYEDMAKTGDIRPSRFVSSVAIILYFYLFIGSTIVSIPIFFILFSNKDALFDIVNMTSSMDLFNKYIPPMLNYILTNFTIYFMLFGAFIAVKFIHYRPFKTLITTKPKIQWSRFFIGFFVYGVLLLLGSVIDYFIFPETYSITFDASKFWIALPIILIMTPIQACTEEFVFRGYVIQGFGLKIKNGIILSIISGGLFALPHLANPEIYASAKLGVFSTVCTVLNYFVIGLVLALITIKTNSLEAAMGAHTVNNLICFILISYPDGVLPTNTVFFTSNFEPVSSLISTTIVGVLFYIITAKLIGERRSLLHNNMHSEQSLLEENTSES